MVLLSSLKCSSNHPLDWLSSQAHSLALAWDYTLRGSWQMHIYVIVSCFQSFRKTGILLLTWDLCHHGGLPQAQSPPGGATRGRHARAACLRQQLVKGYLRQLPWQQPLSPDRSVPCVITAQPIRRNHGRYQRLVKGSLR